MTLKAHHKRILGTSGFSKGSPGRIIRGFERIPFLLKPRNKSRHLFVELPPTTENLDRKRIWPPWLVIISAGVVGLFVQSPILIKEYLYPSIRN